jgi:hypothetical protein
MNVEREHVGERLLDGVRLEAEPTRSPVAGVVPIHDVTERATRNWRRCLPPALGTPSVPLLLVLDWSATVDDETDDPVGDIEREQNIAVPALELPCGQEVGG